ncbi:MAG: metallophosphoesterase [Verrucomicrobia bacterium]|nr:metallophosphoesterase [Verrucomicrobiota bacterium]
MNTFFLNFLNHRCRRAIVLVMLTSTLPTVAASSGLQFDGGDDYVTFGQAPELGAATFTIETWFKRNGPGVAVTTGSSGLVAAVPLVAKGRGQADGSNVDMNWFLGLSGNRLAADFEDLATGLNHPVLGSTAIVDGQWYHAAATYDGSTWRLYLNGVQDAAVIVNQVPRHDSIQHASLGSALDSSGTPAGFLAGALKEVRVWSVARSEAEIAAGMNLTFPAGTPGLLGRWALDETSGTIAMDSSGNAVHGALVNGPLWGDSDVLIVKGPYLQNVTTSTIVVMWETQVPAASRVELGVSGPNEFYVEDSTPTTIHQVVLSGLTESTRYYYTVISDDAHSATGSFRTAPSSPAVPFRFAAYGDTRTYPLDHAAVVRSMIPHDPSFVLHVGDFVGNGRAYSEWSPQYFGPAADLLRNVPLFPVLGNHEYSGTEQLWYFDFFATPDNGSTQNKEHWYAFTYGSARFIGLNACEGGDSFLPGSEQYQWLTNELASAAFQNSRWQFVWTHNPPYTAAERDNAIDANLRTHLVPLFEQHGVDVVFSGDDHFYRRSVRNGIQYVITGGGGAPLHDVGTQMAGATLVYAEKNYEHCIVDVSPTTLAFYVARTDGSVMDTFTLASGGAPPAPSGLVATAGNAQVLLTWNASVGATGYQVKRSLTSGGPYTTIASAVTPTHTDIGLANGTTYYYVVSAVNSEAESADASEANATPSCSTPATPSGLTATPGNAQVALTWTAASGAASYTVKRATNRRGPYAPIATGVGANTYTDMTAVNGTTYYYVVSAVSGCGESANSAYVSARPQAPPAPPAAPTGLSAITGTKAGQIKLTWSASSGASSYTVRRAPTTGGPFSVVKTGVAGTSYTDSKLASGNRYFYVVTAVNASGESLYSNEASAIAK